MHDQNSTPTILIIERDEMLNELLKDALKIEFECVIFSVTSGKNALEMATHVKPDLLIIDDDRLDLNALELSDQLHSITGQASIPTILLNSLVSSWDQSQRYHLIFLRKPFDVLQFYATVKKALTASDDNRE